MQSGSYQRRIYVGQRKKLVVHAVHLLVLEASLLEVGIGEIEQRITIQYAIDGSFQYVGAFISKDLGRLHILQVKVKEITVRSGIYRVIYIGVGYQNSFRLESKTRAARVEGNAASGGS